jgi:hypothetical protein
MTPKEKAQELVDKYLNASFNCKDCDMPYCDMKCTNLSIREAKQCALIAVDEVISNIEPSVSMDVISARIKYWEQVKQEIESL